MRQRRFHAPLRKFEFYSTSAVYRDARRKLEGRHIAILALESVLAGQVSPKKAEQLRKALNSLRAVYQNQWVELEAAVGREASEETRRRAERDEGTNVRTNSLQGNQLRLAL
ncbi:MAG: hypothetical protein ACRD2O_07255 [Terriglobia bacterium]